MMEILNAEHSHSTTLSKLLRAQPSYLCEMLLLCSVSFISLGEKRGGVEVHNTMTQSPTLPQPALDTNPTKVYIRSPTSMMHLPNSPGAASC